MASNTTRHEMVDESSIHVLDFVYPPGETSENISSSITNELIRHFGNSVFVNDNVKSPQNDTAAATSSKNKPQTDDAKQKENQKKNNLVTNHKLFDISNFRENVVDIAVNKKFLCILFDDGSVHRATCFVPDIKDSLSGKHSIKSEFQLSQGRPEPLQVASDESFARTLDRTLNNLNEEVATTISARRSYSLNTQGPTPRNVFINNPYGLRGFSPDFASTALHYMPTMPYRQRRIQWNHLMNVPQNPSATSIIYPQNSEELSQENIEIQDEPQMDLINNITIVSLDSESTPEFQITGLQANMPSQPGMNFPLPNTGISTPTVEREGDMSQSGSQENLQSNIFPQTTSSPTIPMPQRSSMNFPFAKNQNEQSIPGPSGTPTTGYSPKKHQSKQEGSNSQDSFASSRYTPSPLFIKKEPDWSSELGNLQESGLMGQQQFMKMTAMESCFLLIDEEGHLWIWYNDMSQPIKAPFAWNKTETIIAIGCNMFRATVLLESNQLVTFYDKSFKDYNGKEEPELISKLSHGPTNFTEFNDEEILDIQCTNFYTGIQTAQGKVYWWGLAPSAERNSSKGTSKSRFGDNLEIKIGDMVTPKLEKNEMGCLVFNNVLHKFGIVVHYVRGENTTSTQGGVNTDKIVIACLDRDTFNIATDDMIKTFSRVWDAKDVVFLQEQSISTGQVVSFDGQYAIVKMKSNDQGSDLKVYLKSSLEKVATSNESNAKQTRYKKFMMEKPLQVFTNPDFIVVAITANEVGLSFLVNRIKDGKAFLIHPSSVTNDHNNKWFTCGKSDINKSDNIKSECTVTTEFESTPAEESRLCVKQCKSVDILQKDNTLLDHVSDGNIFDTSGVTDDALLKSNTLRELDSALNQPAGNTHGSFSRSFSMPTGGKNDINLKRKWRNTVNIGLSDSATNIVQKPKMFSFGDSQNYTCLLFDNMNCLYPVQFDCSLCNPALLEILPMKSFLLLDRGLQKDKRLLTLIAVPKKSSLITALSKGDKQTVQKAVFKMEIALEDKDIGDDRKPYKRAKYEDSGKLPKSKLDVLRYLDERCNGNQNIMHVAASNILKTDVKIPLLGSIMDVRNNEENVMLQTFLNSPLIWPKIRELLCERDSHGCTPFLTAIMMHNLRGADLILEAVKRDGKNEAKHVTPVDKTFFRKAICQPAFSGLTPVHALIHCSSKKQSSQRWFSTLKISNLPPSYSPRLLLKLFKSRYPSAYRAIMPIPESQWPQRNVRKKLAGGIICNQNTEEQPTSTKPKTKHGPTPFPRMPSATHHRYVSQAGVSGVYRHLSSRASANYANRADMLRANAKEGLVMFGSINEMYQALTEMNNHSLLTKADHPSGALLSVVQHLLQVELYQEKTKFGVQSSSNSGGTTSTTSSAYSAKPNFIPNPLLGDLPYDVSSPGQRLASAGGSGVGGGSTTSEIPPIMREQTINKCFDDIMVHLLMTSLVAADSNILSSVNGEGDTAISYFLTTYPRYSPSHLHKLFLNWRPCNTTNCKYNRHVGNITITSQREVDPPKAPTSDDRSTSRSSSQQSGPSASTNEDDRKLSGHQSQKRKMGENPILTRRGLQNRTGSLRLNVKDKATHSNDYASSPVTPSIRLIANLKFGPIEVNSCSGLTPQIMHPQTASDNMHEGQGATSRKGASNLSPFFPIPGQDRSQVMVSPTPTEDECKCHLNKARLLWNTTFQASVFYLAKNWPCIVSSIMCWQSNSSSDLTFVDCNKLDILVENLLTNPYSILLEAFIKSLMNRFIESKISENAILLPTLHRLNPIDQNAFCGKTFNSLLPWLTVHRFVRSLVRQLSIFLSKNTMPDGNLKLKIGRHANKNHAKKESKMRECLNLCLRAFSWISVIEILKAANTMLRPIRLGTVKAQPKDIIRDIHNVGQPPVGRSHLPTGVRMYIPPGGATTSTRQNIRYASRRVTREVSLVPGNATAMLVEDHEPRDSNTPSKSSARPGPSVGAPSRVVPQGPSSSSSNVPEDDTSDNDETINIDDPFLFAPENAGVVGENFERTETDINEIDWTHTQGITPDSSLAWALDGHIRMRNEVSSRLFTQTGLWQTYQNNQIHQQIMNTPSVHAGYLYLSRMFCRLVKEATDIAKSIQQSQEEVVPGLFGIKPIEFSADVQKALQEEANEQLASTWSWMKEILTTLEDQLNRGDQFDTKHFVLRLKKTAPEGDIAGLGRPPMTHIYGSSPDEYMMYLLKQQMGEDQDTLPVIDLFSYTHLTYVLDAYLYLNKSRAFNPASASSARDNSQEDHDSNVDKEEVNFFKPCINLRSKQGSHAGKMQQFLQHTDEKLITANQIFMWLDENVLKKQKLKKESQTLAICEGKWGRVIDAFSTLFLSEGPGYERESFLSIKAGASGRIARFQRTLTSIRGTDTSRRSYNMMQDNPALLINIHRSNLLNDCINVFSENMANHPFGGLRVRFEGEEGTGPGVTRGLFAAFANALKSGEKYKHWPTEFFTECGNLPTQKGVFSPKVGKYLLQESNFIFEHPMTQEKRYTAFVAIGRFLGLTLWFNQTIPLILSRPILLYLLGKENEISFDDFAFYDSSMYKSFSQLLVDAMSNECGNDEFIDRYNLCFEVTVDGHTEPLVPNGQNLRVSKQNALQFVRLFAHHKMIGCRENELQGLKDGLHQMIPKELLDSLEAEDFQLLLSGGVEEISYQRLRSIITFSNSRGCSRQLLERYKSWFWRILQKMSPSERQKLLYFATGSSVLPALDNRVGNNEELSITVDIINNANSAALPMSSTCGQRISMPLYPSKSVLRSKLLQAIECQTYGLG